METLNDFASHMKQLQRSMLSLTQAADDMAHDYDTHHKEAPL